MKLPHSKILRGLLSLTLVATLLAAPTVAADKFGMSNLNSLNSGAVLLPQTAENGIITEDNGFYAGAVRFGLTFQGDKNAQYFVSVVPGDVAKPDLSKVVYVNQYQADGTGLVTCSASDAPYPSSLTDGVYSVFANDLKLATFTYRAAVAAGNTVSGQIQNHPAAVSTITLTDGLNTYTTQASETFSLTDVVPGTYTLTVAQDGYLTYTIKHIVVTDKDVELPPISLLAGDLDGNGSINSDDLAIVLNSDNYNKTATAAADPTADLNGDGFVNSDDLSIIWNADNYNRTTANCTITIK